MLLMPLPVYCARSCVEKIVALAQAGAHDADRLAEFVLNDLVDDRLEHVPVQLNRRDSQERADRRV
jgi:hypothetical protein